MVFLSKKKKKWSEEQLLDYNCNSKCLDAIFTSISQEEFRRIVMSKTIKDAWVVLEITNQGTKVIWNSGWQMSTSEFGNISMSLGWNFWLVLCQI